VLLDMLADGRLHLSGIACLAPHLTPENREAVLARAVHKSKREIEKLAAELAPRPDAPSGMRKLPDRPAVPCATPEDVVRPEPVAEGRPAPAPAAPQSLLAPRPIEPLSPARYKVQFTAGAEFHDKLERLRALLRSQVPDGDLGAVVEKAVDVMLERLESRRFARTRSPRKKPAPSDPFSRHIPAEIKRAVYHRDGGRCRFEDEDGRRCPERHRLEYHHRHPFGRGGGKELHNISLMCGPHNRYLAELAYGKEVMSQFDRAIRRRRGGTLSGKSRS
jgi:hypothetical protein